MTPFQLEASAKAPCTRTIVSISAPPQRSEGRSHLLAEQRGLLPRCEVATFVEPVVVDEVAWVSVLCPAPRRLIELVGEHADRERDRDVLRLEKAGFVLPVETRRGDPGVRQPVESDVVEDVVFCQVARQPSVNDLSNEPR